jgi:hypothetical protein
MLTPSSGKSESRQDGLGAKAIAKHQLVDDLL